MQKLQKRVIPLIIFLTILLTLAGCDSSEREAEISEEAYAALETMESYIRVFFFDEGTYEDYQGFFTADQNIISEERFNQFQEDNEPEDTFPAGYESVEALMEHMKIEELDSDTVKIYYIEDPSRQDIDEALFHWNLKKVDGQWYIF